MSNNVDVQPFFSLKERLKLWTCSESTFSDNMKDNRNTANQPVKFLPFSFSFLKSEKRSNDKKRFRLYRIVKRMLEALARYAKSQTAASGEAEAVLQEVISASVLLTKHLQKYNQQRLRATFQARPANHGKESEVLSAPVPGLSKNPAISTSQALSSPSDSTSASTGGLEGVMNNSAFSIPTTDASFEESKLSVGRSTAATGAGGAEFGSGELMQMTIQKHLSVPLDLFLTTRADAGTVMSAEFSGRGGSASFTPGGDSPVPRSPLSRSPVPGADDILDGSGVFDSPDILSAFGSWMSLSGTGRSADPWTYQLQNRVLAHVQHIVAQYVRSSDVSLPDVAAAAPCVPSVSFNQQTAGAASSFPDLQTLPNVSTNHLVDVPRNVLVRVWTSRREARKFHRAFRSLREAAVEALLPPSFSTLYSVLVAHRGRLISVTFLLPITSIHPNLLPEPAGTAPSVAPSSVVGAFEAAWRVSLGCLGLPAGGVADGSPNSTGPARKRIMSIGDSNSTLPRPDGMSLLTSPLPLYLGLDGRLYCLTLNHVVSTQKLQSQPASSPASAAIGYPYCTANISPTSQCSSYTSDIFRREDLCTQAAIRHLQRATGTPTKEQSVTPVGAPGPTPKQRGRNPVKAATKALLGAEHSLLAAGIEEASTSGLSEILHAEGCNMSLLGQVLLQLHQFIRAAPEPAAGQVLKRHAAAAAQNASQARSVLPVVFRRILQSLMVLYINIASADCARPPPTADCPHPSFAADLDVVSCAEKLMLQLYDGGRLSLRTAANCLPDENAGLATLQLLAEQKYQVPSDIFLFSLQASAFPMLPLLQESLLLVGLLFDHSIESIVPAAAPTFLCDSGRKQFHVGKYWTSQKTQVEVEVWGKALKIVRKSSSSLSSQSGLRVDIAGEGSRPTSPAVGGGRSPVMRSPAPRDLSDAVIQKPRRMSVADAQADATEIAFEQSDLFSGANDNTKGNSSSNFSPRATCPALSSLALTVQIAETTSGVFSDESSAEHRPRSSSTVSGSPSSPHDESDLLMNINSARFHYGKVARWVFAALCSSSRSARRHAFEALAEYSSVSPVGSNHFRDPTAFLSTTDVDENGLPFYSAIDILKVEKKIAMEQTLMLRLALHFSEVVEDATPPYRPDAQRRGSTTRVGRRASTTISVNMCQMTLAGISAAMLQLLRIANFASTHSSTLPTRSATTITELAKRQMDRASRSDDYRSISLAPLDTLLLAADICVDVGNLLPRTSSSVEDEIHFDVSATSAKLALCLLLTTDAGDFFSAASLQQPMNGWNLFKAKVVKPLHVASFTSIVTLYADLVRRFGHQLSPTITLTVNHPFYARLLSCKKAVMPFFEYIMENTFRVADIPKYIELFRFLIRLSTPLDASLVKVGVARRGKGQFVTAGIDADASADDSVLRSLLYWTLAYFSDFIRGDTLLDQGLEVLHLLWCVSRRSVVLHRLETAILCLMTHTYFQWRRHQYFTTPTGTGNGATSSFLGTQAELSGRGSDFNDDVAHDMEADSEEVSDLLSSSLHVISLAQNFIRRHAAVKHDARQQQVEKGASVPESSYAGGQGDDAPFSPMLSVEASTPPDTEIPPTSFPTTCFMTPTDLVHEKLALLEGENAGELLSTLHQHVCVAQTIHQLQRMASSQQHGEDQQPELLFLEALRGQLEFSITGRKAEKWLLLTEEQVRADLINGESFEFEVLVDEHEIDKKLIIQAAEAMKRLRSSMSSFALMGDDAGGISRHFSAVGVSGAFGGSSPNEDNLASPIVTKRRSTFRGGMGSSNSFGTGFSRSSSSFAATSAAGRGGKMLQLTTMILSTSSEADQLLYLLKTVQGWVRGWTSCRIAAARKALIEPDATYAMREGWSILERPEQANELVKFASHLKFLNSHHREHLFDLRRYSALLATRRASHRSVSVTVSEDGAADCFDPIKSIRTALECHELLDTSHELFLRRVSSDEVISNIIFNMKFDSCRTLLLLTMLVSAVHCSTIANFAGLSVGESCIRRAGDILLVQFKPLFQLFDTARADSHHTVGDLSLTQMRELYTKLALYLQRCASHDIVKVGPPQGQTTALQAAQLYRQKLLQLLRGVEPSTVGPSSIGVAVATALLLADQVITELGLRTCMPAEQEKVLRIIHLACAGFAGSDDDRDDLRKEMLTIPTECVGDLDGIRNFLQAVVEISESKKSPAGSKSALGRLSAVSATEDEARTRRRSTVFPKHVENDAQRPQRASVFLSPSFQSSSNQHHVAIVNTLGGRPIQHDVTSLLSRCMLIVEGYVPALIRDFEVAEKSARQSIANEEHSAFVSLLQSTIGVLSHDQQLLLVETREPMHRQLLSDEAARMWIIIEADFEADYEQVRSLEQRRSEATVVQNIEHDGLRRLLLFQQSDREELEREEVWEREHFEWVSSAQRSRQRGPNSSTSTTSTAVTGDCGSSQRATGALSHREAVDREALLADEARHFLAIRDCFAIEERNMLLYFDTERRNELFAVGYDGDAQEQLDDEAQLRDAVEVLEKQEAGSLPAVEKARHRVRFLVSKLVGQLTTREIVCRSLLVRDEESLRASVEDLMHRTRRSDAILAYDFRIERTKRVVGALEDEEMIERRRVERSREAHHAQLCRDVDSRVLAICHQSQRLATERQLRPSKMLDTMLHAEGAGRAAIDQEFRQSARLIVALSHRSIALLSTSQPIEWQTLVAQQHDLLRDEEAERRALEEEEEETFFRQSIDFDANHENNEIIDNVANDPMLWWNNHHDFSPLRSSSVGSDDGKPTMARSRCSNASGLTQAALEEHQSLLSRANAVAAFATVGTLTPRPPAALSSGRNALSSRTPAEESTLFASASTRAARMATEASQKPNVSPLVASLAFNPGDDLSVLLLQSAPHQPGRTFEVGGTSPPLPRISVNNTSHQTGGNAVASATPGLQTCIASRAGGGVSRQQYLPKIFANPPLRGGRPVAPAEASAIEQLEQEETTERSIVDDERQAAWTVMALAWSRAWIESRRPRATDQTAKFNRIHRR